MRARRLALAPLAGLLAAAACEHGITLRGSVTIPPEVQQRFSRERPGVVIVSGSIPKSSGFGYRVAVLCEPAASALVAPFFHDGFGCAEEGVVRAWAAPAEPGLTQCGMEQAHAPGSAPEPATAAAEEVVFAGRTESWGCSSGEDEVALLLRPL